MATHSIASAPSVEQQLASYHDRIAGALVALVPRREPRRYLYDLLADQLARGGKGLRPALCLATCGAFGGDLDDAVPSAVALELLHNGFLVHDDVEDGSLYRRDQPTLYAQYGVGLAVNVGDAMHALAIRPLIDNLSRLEPETGRRVWREIEHMLTQSLEGQAIELGWIRDRVSGLTDADYLRMVLKKTTWYTCIHPCRIGALIATGDADDLDRFNAFGAFLGAAFQIQDDVLNLIGRYERYGKEILGDLWEGKRTLVLIHLERSATEYERTRLAEFLAQPRPERQERDVLWVYELIERYGSVDYARSSARQLAEAARQEFAVAYAGALPGPDRDFLYDLASFMVERDV